MDETGEPGEHHRPAASHGQTIVYAILSFCCINVFEVVLFPLLLFLYVTL
jgi:hypothetical protein